MTAAALTTLMLLAGSPLPLDQATPPAAAQAQPATGQTTPPPAPAPDASAQPPAAPGATQVPPVTAPTAPATTTPAPKAPSAAGAPNGQGDIVVTGRVPSPTDPLENVNVKSFEVVQSVDRGFVRPVSMTYKQIVPSPFRRGLRNFLNNLGEPAVFVNYLLQLKPGKAAETFGRFTVNSTIGVGGVIDVAKNKPFHLPRRPNGFANTLGYYGVKPGAYMYLPFAGPTTVRDLIGGTIDRLLLPLAVGKPFTELAFVVPFATLSALGSRVEQDDLLHTLHDVSDDPYLSTRLYYLRRRQAEIDALHGKHPAPVRPEDAVIVHKSDPLPSTPLPSTPLPTTPDAASPSTAAPSATPPAVAPAPGASTPAPPSATPAQPAAPQAQPQPATPQ